jgi:hypothetical protein
MTGLFAAPASVSQQKNVNHNTVQSVSFDVGGVCGWGANAIQVSVNGSWTTGSTTSTTSRCSTT